MLHSVQPEVPSEAAVVVASEEVTADVVASEEVTADAVASEEHPEEVASEAAVAVEDSETNSPSSDQLELNDWDFLYKFTFK